MLSIRCAVSILGLIILLTLTACNQTNSAAVSPAAPTAAPTEVPAAAPTPEPLAKISKAPAQSGASTVRIEFVTQEYEGENIVEIPFFAYDEDRNDAADSINRLLNQGLRARYEEFLAQADDDAWIEILSYPFTDDQYAQVVITRCVYPNINGSGAVESVNYDKRNGAWIQFSDLGIGEDFISEAVGRLYAPENKGALIDSVNVAGFLLRPQGGEIGEFTEIYLEITTIGGGGDSHTSFYAFCPDTDEFYQFDPVAAVPFSHADMDHMDPPLYYDRFEPQTGGEAVASGVIYTGSLLEGDSGDYMTPLDAARGLYKLVLRSAFGEGSDYGADDPMYIMCVDVVEIGGGECYQFDVTGSFGAARYAVNYATGEVYALSESGCDPLGRINI